MPMFGNQINTYTWATRPSVATLDEIICISDVGAGGSLWRGDGTNWIKMGKFIYYTLPSAVTLTGTTTPTQVASFVLNGKVLGAKGTLTLLPLAQVTNNANNKTMSTSFGGVTVFSQVYASTLGAQPHLLIRNTAENAQVSFSSGSQVGFGVSSVGALAGTVDTTADVTVAVTVTLANASDSFTLHSLIVEVA